MEFKETKGKWIIDEYNFGINEFGVQVFSISREDKKEIRMADVYGNIANALLISKAPQLLEEHNVDIDQIEVWIEWLKDLENDERYTGIIDTMKKCIEVKKQLIKEATEL